MGNSGLRHANKGLPVDQDVVHRSSPGGRSRPRVRFDPVPGQPVPLGGRTGVDRCRMPTSTPAPATTAIGPPGAFRGCAVWVDDGDRPLGRQTAARPRRSDPLPTHRRQAREQEDVPAEQPPPPQGAWLPPADAHPRRPRHSVLASPQGSQEHLGLTSRRPVLTRANRLTSSRLFAPTIRRGARAGTRTLVVHLAVPPAVPTDASAQTPPGESPVVGFVVSKAVGGAVVRNQVKRRLRHLARERLESLPGSAVLVVRALPPAATTTSAQLGVDLDSALLRVLRPRDAQAAR